MEATAILGLIADLIQIGKFSVEFVVTAKRIHDTLKGRVDSAELDNFVRNLTTRVDDISKVAPDDAGLAALCQKSRRLAKEILTKLDTMRIAGTGKRAVLSKTLKEMVIRKDIERLEREIQDCVDSVMVYFAVLQWDHTSHYRLCLCQLMRRDTDTYRSEQDATYHREHAIQIDSIEKSVQEISETFRQYEQVVSQEHTGIVRVKY